MAVSSIARHEHNEFQYQQLFPNRPMAEGNSPNTTARTHASAFPTTLSDLTFSSSLDPDTSTNIYKALSVLRKSTLSIPNRLVSVLQDAEFIEALYGHLQNVHPLDAYRGKSDGEIIGSANDRSVLHSASWALIPNERSGSWPLSPNLKLESQRAYLSAFNKSTHPSTLSAYFKSTDGHVNQWSFSTRRLNLPVLELLGFAGGAVLIDTTRRGKSYPDALRRTLPVFTSVWNQTLFGDSGDTGVNDFQAFGLEKGEISQIEGRLPAFVQSLKGLGLPLDGIRKKVERPTRCVWVAQPSTRNLWSSTFDDLVQRIESEKKKWQSIGGVNMLICCSASRRILGAEMSEDGYIQGAGDDSEGWSKGLTASTFWNHKDELMKSIELGEDIETLVQDLVQRDREKGADGGAIEITPTGNLFLGTKMQDSKGFDLVICCNAAPKESDPQFLGLGCKEGKLGSKMLRGSLPEAEKAVQKVLQKSSKARILVTCSTGKDLSVGVILMTLCRFYDENGMYCCGTLFDQADLNEETVRIGGQKCHVDKQMLKQRLAWITTSKPDANPSRATLQAVNSVLIDRPR